MDFEASFGKYTLGSVLVGLLFVFLLFASLTENYLCICWSLGPFVCLLALCFVSLMFSLFPCSVTI